MRLAAFALLALGLASCSRQPPAAAPLSVLGEIVLPATDPKLGPHPDANLKFDEFVAKHFPNEWRQLCDLDAKRAELEVLVDTAHLDANNPLWRQNKLAYSREQRQFGIARTMLYNHLQQKVSVARAEMRNPGRR